MKMIKILSAVSALFLIATVGFAQKQDIEVFEKKEGSKVIVMARNTGKVDYSVSVDITSSGMDVSPSNKIEKIIQPGFMKEMAYLTPIAGESWEYSYDVSFVQHREKDVIPSPPPPAKEMQTTNSLAKPVPPPPTKEMLTTTTSDKLVAPSPTPASASKLSSADLIVYTKPGCSRCEFVKKQLKSSGINFEEYSTSSNSPEINNMWSGLRNSGFDGGSVTMPVVRSNGKYFYNIPDLNAFVAKLKKS